MKTDKKIPKTRTFRGKVYNLHNTVRDRGYAYTLANKLSRQGYLTEVVEIEAGERVEVDIGVWTYRKGKWAIYARSNRIGGRTW